MRLPRLANRRARIPALAAVGLALGACRAADAREEFEVALSARGGPGVGAGASFAQRLFEHGERHWSFVLGVERQRLSEEGPGGDEWTRAWSGFRDAPDDGSGWVAGLGVTWLRSDVGAADLPEPGDFGGAYVEADWWFPVGRGSSTGPGVVLYYVDAEGSGGESGGVAELAWSWVWRF